MRFAKSIITRLLDKKITIEQALEQLKEIVDKSNCPSNWTRAKKWVDELEPEVNFRKEHPDLFKHLTGRR